MALIHGGWDTIIFAVLYWTVLAVLPAIVITMWARWLIARSAKL
jgi:hypothetical protein